MANFLKGKIVALPSEKTVVVSTQRYFTHPMYKKRIRRTKKYLAHYEGTDIKIGDDVELVETKPISKKKHHKIKV